MYRLKTYEEIKVVSIVLIMFKKHMKNLSKTLKDYSETALQSLVNTIARIKVKLNVGAIFIILNMKL